MKVTVYINEDSFQGQLCSGASGAINNLLAVVNTLAGNQGVDVSVLTSSAIFSKQVCSQTGLILAQLSKADHDLFLQFKGMLDKAKYWDKDVSVQSPTAIYLYKKQSVHGTSVAEARECVETGMEAIVVSVPGTVYTGNMLDIEKDGFTKNISHALTTADVFDYLRSKGIALQYDRSKFLRVDDMQTVLADTSRFSATQHKKQGRTVYERIGKNEYWYVDNFHRDGSVHLEVFRMSDGSFIGTCDIEDVNKFKTATKREKERKEPLKF